MAHDGSDLESSYSEHNNNDLFPSINCSSKNNDLAPSINNSNVKYPTIHSDEESIDISEHSSVRQFRNIFNKQKILNRSEESVKEGSLFRLHFDTTSDIELSTLSSERDISLDSSIIGKILISEAQANDDRFQYLKAYENLKKQHGKNLEDDASIFDLSLMDDYNKYIKQTEINDIIHQGVIEKHKDNVLSIVKSRDLAENFYHDDKSDDLKWVKSKKKRRIPWYRIDKNINRKESSTESLFGNEDALPPSNKKQSRYLQRKLKIRHLQMISFGGTLGVGLFLNSGKAFVLAGGFGTLLAFTICGLIVLATMVSFCEMVTFVSVIDGVSGLSSRFVDESFGFAVGWLYFASFAFGLAGEILASVMMLSYYPNLKIVHHKGSIAGFVTLFLSLIVISNLVDVRIFGEIEYISSLIKIICVLIMIVIMIVLNTGGFGSENIGFKYWQRLKSDFEHNLIFGLFRPSFNLKDNGSTNSRLAISGDKGRFLSLLTALLVTAYAYSGTEIVCIAACEAKNPRKALPSATRRVFWRIIILYCLSIFLVSLNIYAGDPRLLRYLLGNTNISGDEHEINEYAIKYVGGINCNSDSTVFGGFGSGAQSPWIVALQSASLCKFSSASNALLTFFAVSCGNAQLYVSSRTIYSLALQKKAPRVLTYCNKYGIPYNAVLFSACFGLFAYLCVSEKATIVFQDLTSIISSSGIIAWFAMCLSFIRFYYGLKLRPDIISRNDKAYPYKSPFQPYSAILGLVGSGLIILAMGYVVFLDGEWDTLFFFSSYGSLMVFVVLYVGHRLVTGSRTPNLETLDYDSGRREMDRYVWDAGREFNLRSFKEVAQRIISFLA